MASDPITSCQVDGETMETVTDFIFLGSIIIADADCIHEIKKTFLPWKKIYEQHRQHSKKLRCELANKGPCIQSYGFSISHGWI